MDKTTVDMISSRRFARYVNMIRKFLRRVLYVIVRGEEIGSLFMFYIQVLVDYGCRLLYTDVVIFHI